MTAVTAVVPTHNGGDRLLRTIDALERQTIRLTQIIVVDDASDDGSVERLMQRSPRVCLVRLDANVGLSAARNAGLRQAQTDLVLTVDHDIYLAPDCVQRLAQAREDRKAIAACPRIVLEPGGNIVQADGAEPHFVGTLALRHGYQSASELPSTESEWVAAVPGGCLLLQRIPVLEAGGFEELIFFYFEDLELSLRLRSLGYRFIVVPSALAHHDRGPGVAGLTFRGEGSYPARRLQLTHRHRLFALLVHYRARTLLLLAPALLAYELAGLGMAVGKGHGGEWVRAWRWQFHMRSAILDRRRRMQRQRSCPDRAILAGGPLPLAPGVARSEFARRAVQVFSSALNLYWRLVRRLIG